MFPQSADPRIILRHPAVYSAFTIAMGGRGSRRRIVEDYVRPWPGAAVLDLGCGPGTMLEFLEGVDYTGVDQEKRLIEHARRRFGDKGKFIVADATCYRPDGEERFDIIVAYGLLHHLDDAAARKLFALANSLLKEGRWLITLDPCFTEGQSRIARLLAKYDRGRHVRDESAYLELAGTVFDRVKAHIRHDLLTLPYTSCILTCQASAPARPAP